MRSLTTTQTLLSGLGLAVFIGVIFASQSDDAAGLAIAAVSGLSASAVFGLWLKYIGKKSRPTRDFLDKPLPEKAESRITETIYAIWLLLLGLFLFLGLAVSVRSAPLFIGEGIVLSAALSAGRFVRRKYGLRIMASYAGPLTFATFLIVFVALRFRGAL